MKREFWEARWDQGQIGFHREAVGAMLEKYVSVLPEAPSCILVPLCGKSIDLLYLAERGHRVIGAELSKIAVDAFFEEQQLGFTISEENGFSVYRAERDDLDLVIYCGDFFELSDKQLSGVDAVWDRASLVALPAELRERYAGLLAKELGSGTPYLLVSVEYDIPGKDGPPFCLGAEILEGLFEGLFTIERLDPGVSYEADVAGYFELPYLLSRM